MQETVPLHARPLKAVGGGHKPAATPGGLEVGSPTTYPPPRCKSVAISVPVHSAQARLQKMILRAASIK